ncbi:MAG: hypothetical protein ACHQ1D_03050 [Nitrososphaerales archaeon]
MEVLIKYDLIQNSESARKRIFAKLFGAALGGIPWVGGYLSALSEFRSDNSQIKNNKLFEEWLTEHSKKMRELAEALSQITNRLDEFSDSINDRLESEEYLQIVRKSFRAWDNADTFEKKDLIRKLLTNSGASKLVPDDLIRLFLDWISTYHEVHFAVIKAVYQSPGITRYEIWQELNGVEVREDSLEADLFKLLIRDLSTGSVIRQHRQTDYAGNFMKKSQRRSANPTATLKSAFDDQESYELTELGKQFVHYTMNEVVSRINE